MSLGLVGACPFQGGGYEAVALADCVVSGGRCPHYGPDATGCAQNRAAGELVWAWHVTIAPSWFDPGEVPAQITPFTILYALHDAVIRAMPGERMGNSLAESWTESPDGLVYEFKLRQGLRFHNGDSCTAEDVTFTFERYKGAGAREIKDKVKRVEIVDP